MSSVATFNMCLESARDNRTVTKTKDLEKVLEFANGFENEEGENINTQNSKDWKDRMFENLPFKADDILFINLPQVATSVVANQNKRKPSLSVITKFESFVDDIKGNLFVFSGFLKPGIHQIIVYDQITTKFWAKNIIVDLRKSEIIPGKVIKKDLGPKKFKTDEGI